MKPYEMELRVTFPHGKTGVFLNLEEDTDVVKSNSTKI